MILDETIKPVKYGFYWRYDIMNLNVEFGVLSLIYIVFIFDH